MAAHYRHEEHADEEGPLRDRRDPGPAAAPAAAAPGTAHGQGGAAGPARAAAKRVSLVHHGTIIPAANCGTTKGITATGNGLHASVRYAGTCLGTQEAWIDRAQTGLTERLRIYNTHNSLVFTGWLHGRIFTSSNNSITAFASSPNTPNVKKVCEALVANSNHNDVKYGQVCETI